MISSLNEYSKPQRPIRVLQFGTGGFLRGFADWMLQKLNDTTDFDGSVIVVQSTQSGQCDRLNSQNCLYTHTILDAETTETEIIDIIDRCINIHTDYNAYLKLAEIPTLRFIISNTTEAGIIYDEYDRSDNILPNSFPGRLTALLKHRYDSGLPGFIFLPCELISRNGDVLKDCIFRYARLWNYECGFFDWIEKQNIFCCTLVDRINIGYPTGIDLKLQDSLANASEMYHLWVIESKQDIESELPLPSAGLNVIYTKDALEEYYLRKVRILNGAHTAMVCKGLLSGLVTVKDCLDDPQMADFLKSCIFDEIIPTLDMPREELEKYARDVFLRFSNPYIDHKLSAISLNSISKFKVRLLPSILAYRERFGHYPVRLSESLAKLLEFYKTMDPNDDPDTIQFIKFHTTQQILGNRNLWGEDLSEMIEVIAHEDP